MRLFTELIAAQRVVVSKVAPTSDSRHTHRVRNSGTRGDSPSRSSRKCTPAFAKRTLIGYDRALLRLIFVTTRNDRSAARSVNVIKRLTVGVELLRRGGRLARVECSTPSSGLLPRHSAIDWTQLDKPDHHGSW
jgi:hypothetical protein